VKTGKKNRVDIEISMVLLALLFLIPFYFVLVNSVKSVQSILSDTAGLPTVFQWENYVKAWRQVRMPRAFFNTLINTAFTDIITMIITPMAAYHIVRHPSKFNRIVMTMFVASMVIPVQAIVIPLIQEFSWLGILNTRLGLVTSYVGIGLAFSSFLFYGFVKTIPVEIEESAIIDGCSSYGVFWRIVFPLLKPMTTTVILLKTLWCWNEYLLSVLLLHRPEVRTIQLAVNALFSEYRQQWDLALPALVMGITPALLFFLFLQRYVVEGITLGAVKG
jgi:raffinose/stachyose/melibiose transport system permease protein